MKKVFNVYINGVYLQMCKPSEVALFTKHLLVGENIRLELIEIEKTIYNAYFNK
jgi:hypothetical protein